MKTRTIRAVIAAQKVNMGGMLLDQPLPHPMVDQIDPFLLVHHLKHTYEEGKRQHEVGVPPHPHRGFVPVTFVFEGGVHHRDSMGNSSVIYGGGTQWMHAGKGIVHSERPAVEIAEKGQTWELIQFWVNLPAQYKMTPPEYLSLTAEETPSVTSDDGLAHIAIVSGEYQGLAGGIKAYSPVTTLRLTLQAGATVSLPLDATHNAFLYQLDGELTINGERKTQGKDLTWFKNDGEHITIEAHAATRAILLSGAPIDEPLATYGPFVMNHQAELMHAIRDYQSGQMGVLEEQFD